MTIESSPLRQATWPGLDAVPAGPRAAVSAVVARRIFTAAVRRLPVTVHLEDGPGRSQVLGLGGPAMTVHRPDEFFARLGRHGLIGFGEAYLTTAWDARDLAGFLTVLAADLPTLVPSSLQKARALVVARPPRTQRGTQTNSRQNIAHHYDLSNDLFATFLDQTLSYSSALFDTPIRDHDEHLVAIPPGGEAATEPLAEAQARKIERLLDAAGVGDGTRLLEIGTGWGELAIRAARRGARVRSVTLSTEQQALARDRIAAAGMADRVERRPLRLPGHRGAGGVRRGGLRRDDRGGRARVLADVLPDARPRPRARRQDRPPGHRDAARPDAGDPAHAHVDQQVHLPGRLPPVRRGDRAGHPRPHDAARDRAAVVRQSLRRDPAPLGRRVQRVARPGPRARLRRDVRADVALLPGVLPGRVRLGLPRRRADRARAEPGESPPRSPTTASRSSAASCRCGSRLGRLRGRPVDAPRVSLRTPRRPTRLLWHPGELGAAQAYVTGELEVHGDVGGHARPRARRPRARPPAADAGPHRPAAARPRPLRRETGALGRPPAPPATQAVIRGRLHSLARDRASISHHYDLSNEFYEFLLDPHMAYSSGYGRRRPGHAARAGAAAKLDLVCRKVGLREGTTFLDVGCGWGSLSLYAAEHFGAQVTGVTIAAEQKAFIDAASPSAGWATGSASSCATTARSRAARSTPSPRSRWASTSARRTTRPTPRCCTASVRPGGSVLVQQMSRFAGHHPGGGPFIEQFIAPDMTMRPVGDTLNLLQGAGFEVRDVHALREHYVWTVDAWHRTLEENWDRAVRAHRRGGGPGLAALPRRRLAGVPRRPDGRRPAPPAAARWRAGRLRLGPLMLATLLTVVGASLATAGP